MKFPMITSQPERVFTFGCSFTHYSWPTWTQVVALDLDIPMWNYGRSGAGNQFISTMLTQSIKTFDINERDLVMVGWTNVCREDRFVRDDWRTVGNIFSQQTYSDEWMAENVDPVGYAMRDFATMEQCRVMLNAIGCQWHFFSMLDVFTEFDQGQEHNLLHDNQDYLDSLYIMYPELRASILGNYYHDLWDGDLQSNHFPYVRSRISQDFHDGHPLPGQHLQFLQKIFDHEFKSSTLDKVAQSDDLVVKVLREFGERRPPEMDGYQAYNMDAKAEEEIYLATMVQNCMVDWQRDFMRIHTNQPLMLPSDP